MFKVCITGSPESAPRQPLKRKTKTRLQALEPNPEDKLHLRLHRARSVVLTSDE